jgi:hypothetical protein
MLLVKAQFQYFFQFLRLYLENRLLHQFELNQFYLNILYFITFYKIDLIII